MSVLSNESKGKNEENKKQFNETLELVVCETQLENGFGISFLATSFVACYTIYGQNEINFCS